MKYKYLLLSIFQLTYTVHTNNQFVEKEGYYNIKEDQLEDFITQNEYIVVYYRKLNNEKLEKYDEEFMKVIQNKKKAENYLICQVETEDNDLPDYRLYSTGFYRDFDFEPQYRRILSWSKLNFTRKPKLQKLTKSKLKMLNNIQSYLIFKFPKDDKDFKEKIENFTKLKLGKQILWTDEDFHFKFQGKPYEMIIGRNFGDGNKVYSQNAPFQSLFIQQLFDFYSQPHVQIYKEYHQKKLFEGKKIVFYFDEQSQTKENKYSEISSKFKNKIVSYLTDMKEQYSQSFGRFLGVSKEDFPTIRAVQYKLNNRQWSKYKPNEDQNIEQFIKAFIKDEQEEYVKEEPILEHEKNYQFKKIVRGNFNEVINDKKKHALIAFVTDWCEHCKEIKPAFDEIKAILKDEIKDITFGIINVDKNDIDLNFKNFPTIYFYKKGQKDKPINYEGMRDAEVILNFVENELGGNIAIYNRKMPEELQKQQDDIQQKVREQQQQKQSSEQEDYDL